MNIQDLLHEIKLKKEEKKNLSNQINNLEIEILKDKENVRDTILSFFMEWNNIFKLYKITEETNLIIDVYTNKIIITVYEYKMISYDNYENVRYKIPYPKNYFHKNENSLNDFEITFEEINNKEKTIKNWIDIYEHTKRLKNR